MRPGRSVMPGRSMTFAPLGVSSRFCGPAYVIFPFFTSTIHPEADEWPSKMRSGLRRIGSGWAEAGDENRNVDRMMGRTRFMLGSPSHGASLAEVWRLQLLNF